MSKKRKKQSSRTSSHEFDRFDDLVRGVKHLGDDAAEGSGHREVVGKSSSGSSLADRLDGDVLEKLKAIGGAPVKGKQVVVSGDKKKIVVPAKPAPEIEPADGTRVPANAVEHGSFDGVTWHLDRLGCLVIEPANGDFGDIKRWGFGRFPWRRVRSEVKHVVVKSGVKAARLDYAFADCPSLVDADLSGLDASSLSGIACLFSKCQALRSVSLKGWSSAVLADTDAAFRECPMLESVNLEGCHPRVVSKISKAVSGNRRCEVIKDVFWSGVSGEVAWEVLKPGSGQNEGRLTLAPANGSLGKMEDWRGDGPPWREIAHMIKEVVVMPGVEMVTMEGAFRDCRRLVSADLSGLNLSGASSMAHAFSGCSSLERADLSGLDASSVDDMRGLFANCPELRFVDLSGWKASRLRRCDSAFEGSDSVTTIDVRGWDCPDSVRRLRESLPSLLKWVLKSSLKSWEWIVPIGAAAFGRTGSVVWWLTGDEDRSDPGCMRLKAIPGSDGLMGSFPAESWRCHAEEIRRIKVEEGVRARSLDFAFSGLGNLTRAELGRLDVSKTESFSMAFADCGRLEEIDLSEWSTSRLRDADGMFSGCRSLKTVSVGSWDTSSLKTTYSMFAHCASLQEIDLSKWSTGAVEDCSYMFEGCSSLASLNLAGWGFDSVEHCEEIFKDCSSVRNLALSFSRKEAPDLLQKELLGIPSEAVQWLGEPPFSPGDKVLFGMMPQAEARLNALSWTVLESSIEETVLLCDRVIDCSCAGIMSTSMPIERYEELLTRDFNHFCFSRLEKRNAGGAIRVGVPRAGTPVFSPDAVRSVVSSSSWALKRGVAQDARGRSSWLAYDDASRRWGKGSISGHPQAKIQSTPSGDFRGIGLRPVITVANLKKPSVGYWNERRDIFQKEAGEEASIGDTLTFGIYPQDESVSPIEWIVTDKADGKMLLVSKKIIETEEAANGIASIEQWLNEDFFVKAFCRSFNDEGQWRSNAAYEDDVKECNSHRSLVFSLTHVDYDCYRDVIGSPETTRYAMENGVCVEDGRADWRLFRTWYVWAGREKSPKGIRPAIQVDMRTGEIVPRVLHPDYENLSFPYRPKAEAPDFDSAMSESILAQAGYTVRATSPLTTAQRQAILLDLIKRKVISRNSVVKHLKWCIAIRRTNPSMRNAIAKWQEDINYLNNLWKN